ncbi:lipase secretion chaperone [Marinobacter sp.]|uniref:lipase secretion chaperone n=1 Tax=Marinobacter sp. TaxID=50741 RepID=UPI0035623891
MKKSYLAGLVGISLFIAFASMYSFWWGGAARTGSDALSINLPSDEKPVVTVSGGGVRLGALPSESSTALPPLPRDERVADIEVDGAVRIDMNGNLVLDRDLRRFMDFFIGLAPDRRYEGALKQRMQAVMESDAIPSGIQAEVLVILDDYLAYREAAAALEQQGDPDPADIQAVFDVIYSMRREYLGPDVAEGFFGQEERRLRMTLDRQRILADDTLSESEKALALAQVDQMLPAHARQAKEVSETVVSMVQEVQRLRASGASEAEVRALRMEKYGAEATGRLELLDQKRQQWQRRVASYEQRKLQLLQAGGLAPDDRERALEALRAEIFQEEHERRRIRALDKASGSAG